MWWLVSTFGVLMLTAGGAATWFYTAVTPKTQPNPQATSNPHTDMMNKAVQGIGQAISGTKPMNVLLIANNARNAKGPLSLGSAAGQADILLLAHIDPAAHSVTLISIPRDTLIAMPGWKVPIPKIKTAFTVGLEESPQKGPELAMQYVSQMTGLPVTDYIVTDFQGFVDAINAIGGVQVDVKQKLYTSANSYHPAVNLNPGVQTLSGEQALAYIRVRQNEAGNSYRTNDFQRQQAEVQLLVNLKQKLLNSSTNPVKLLKLVHVWSQDVATNLSTSQLVGIGMESAGAKLNTVQLGSVRDSMNLAGANLSGVNEENYLTGAYYDILNQDKITQLLKPYGSHGANLGLPPLPTPGSVPVVVYGSQSAAVELQKAGFPTTYAGQAAVNRDSVYYPPMDMPWGWSVARVLGTSNAWVAPGSNTSAVVVYAR